MTDETANLAAGFLGLCQRAGQVSLGQEACVSAIRKREAALVLLDSECSGNTRKRFSDACGTYATPLYFMPAGRIAKAVGKAGRMVAAIGPGGMAQKLLVLLSQEKPVSDCRAENYGKRKQAEERSF